jgi:hypothetical protein
VNKSSARLAAFVIALSPLLGMGNAYAETADDLVPADGPIETRFIDVDQFRLTNSPIAGSDSMADTDYARTSGQGFANIMPGTMSGGAMPAADFVGPRVPDDEAVGEPGRTRRYTTLGSQIGIVKWELLGIVAYTSAVQLALGPPNSSFHFIHEGYFGKNTENLGIDKLTHGFNAYLFSEFLGARIARRTGDRMATALPGALLGFGLQFYGELWDAHKSYKGFSREDIVFNAAGSLFSYARHTIPGLEDKLDFRLMTVPNSKLFARRGKVHYEQQRFLLSLQASGFKGLRETPLRFVEFQMGYRGKDFSLADRAAGIIPKRDIFFGLALNLKELFFKNTHSRLGRAIRSGLNYFQIPVVATHLYDGF